MRRKKQIKQRRKVAVPNPTSVADALKKTRISLQTIEKGHRERLHKEYANIYRYAVRLRADRDDWLTFCHDPEWEGPEKARMRPQEDDAENALQYAVRMAVGFGEGTAKRVYDIKQALKGFFAENLPPQRVLQEIEEAGGVAKLRNAEAPQTQPNVAAKSPSMVLKLPLEGRLRENIVKPNAHLLIAFDKDAKPKIVKAIPSDKQRVGEPCNALHDTLIIDTTNPPVRPNPNKEMNSPGKRFIEYIPTTPATGKGARTAKRNTVDAARKRDPKRKGLL